MPETADEPGGKGLPADDTKLRERKKEFHKEDVDGELGDVLANKSFSFVYRHVFDSGIIEYEYDHVFVSEYFGEVSLNPEGKEEYKWISCSELDDYIIFNVLEPVYHQIYSFVKDDRFPKLLQSSFWHTHTHS